MLLEYGRENGEILRHEVYRCATITEIADFMNDEGDRYFGRDHSPWMQRMDGIHLRFAVAVASR